MILSNNHFFLPEHLQTVSFNIQLVRSLGIFTSHTSSMLIVDL